MPMIKMMHTKFGINYEGWPRQLEKEEYIFRCIAMQEELLEYIEAIFETDYELSIKDTIQNFKIDLERMKLKTNMNLAEQFDALVDLSVFLRGTCERQGFPYDEGWEEVMEANIRKELVTDISQSKRGFKADLVKPKGWTPPNMKQFVYPKGLIILDGPDVTGKSYLAEKFAIKFNGTVFHHTWSEEIDKTIPSYFRTTLASCVEIIELGSLCIIDRLYLSEQIYSEIFRNNARKWETEMVNISTMVKNMDAIEIICLPYQKEKFATKFAAISKKRFEMYDDMFKVYDKYAQLFKSLDNTYFRYDMFTDNVDTFIEDIGGILWGNQSI